MPSNCAVGSHPLGGGAGTTHVTATRPATDQRPSLFNDHPSNSDLFQFTIDHNHPKHHLCPIFIKWQSHDILYPSQSWTGRWLITKVSQHFVKSLECPTFLNNVCICLFLPFGDLVDSQVKSASNDLVIGLVQMFGRAGQQFPRQAAVNNPKPQLTQSLCHNMGADGSTHNKTILILGPNR